jgi:cell division protease FtsH
MRYYLGDDLPGCDLRAITTLAADGATGANVFAWVNRARATARRQNRTIELSDLVAAVEGNRSPPSGQLRRQICAHEAGHALASVLLGAGEIEAVVIHADGGAAHFEIDGTELMTLSGLERRIAVLLAGRAAEILMTGEVSIGASVGSGSDLERATALAIEIETMRGMGGLGLVYCPQAAVNIARNPLLLAGVKARLAAADTRVTELLAEHRGQLAVLTDELERTGYLSGTQVKALVQPEPLRAAS